jgi:tetratricopeptide (TPR) repeat protein
MSCQSSVCADNAGVNPTPSSPAEINPAQDSVTQVAHSSPCPHRQPRIIATIVFALAFIGMARICANDFVAWDDSFTLYNNAKLNPPTAESLAFYWTHAEHGLYMPGTQTVWWGLAKIARSSEPDVQGVSLNPTVFHFASVAFHATAALAMFLLLRRLLGAVRGQEFEADGSGGDMTTEVAAAIGALLFALHPVQVESVAWAAGMKDVLYGLFALIALWQYVIAVQSSSSAPRNRVMTHFALATAAFVWAILCKPTAMVVPALAVVIHIVVLRGNWRKALKWTAAWWPITLVAMIVARMAQQVDANIAAPIWARPLVATDALAFYAGKLLVPLKLCIDYGRSPTVAQDSGWLYWTWLIPAAAAALMYWRPRREFIAAALLTTICVAPVLGLSAFMFQFYSTVSDHYLYLALLGPALGVAWFVSNHEKHGRPIAIGLVALLAIQSFNQSRTWRDDEALFSHTLANNPNSFVASSNLGGSYDSLGDAMLAGAKIAEENNDRITAQSYRKLAAENYQQARELYLTAIEKRKLVNRGVDDYLKTRGLLAAVCGKLGDHAEALANWTTAEQIARNYHPEAARELPNLYCLAARELLAMKRADEALARLDRAREIDSSNPAVQQMTEQAHRMLAATPMD